MSRRTGMKYISIESLLDRMDRALENVQLSIDRDHPMQAGLNAAALIRYGKEFRKRYPGCTREDIEVLLRLSE